MPYIIKRNIYNHFTLTQLFDNITQLQGLKKILNSSLSFGQAAITLCLLEARYLLLVLVNYFVRG